MKDCNRAGTRLELFCNNSYALMVRLSDLCCSTKDYATGQSPNKLAGCLSYVVQEMSKAIVAARKKSWQPGKNSYGEVEVRQVSER